MQQFVFVDENKAKLTLHHLNHRKHLYIKIEDYITIPSVSLTREDVIALIETLEKILKDGE